MALFKYKLKSIFGMLCWIIFLVILLVTVDITGSDKLETDISRNVKKRPIGWADPDEMVYDGKELEWINPFDMLGNNKLTSKNANHDEMQANNLRNSLNKYEAYMRRFINLFLRCSGLEGYSLGRGSKKQVHFDIIIDHEQLTILQTFGHSGKGLVDVDEVLSKLFIPKGGTFFEHRSSTHEKYVWLSNIFEYINHKITIIFNSPERVIFLVVTFTWLITLWIFYMSGSYRVLFVNIFILVFFAGFAFTWVRMYQEAEAERFHAEMMKGDAPSYCKGDMFSWYANLYYFMYPPDCSKYYKTVLIDSIIKVSPSVVLAETISQMFLQPVSHIGKAYGDFVMAATGAVSWYLKIIIAPLALIIPVILLFGIIVLSIGSKISLSPFGFSILPQRREETFMIKQNKKYIVVKDESDQSMIGSVLSKVSKPFKKSYKKKATKMDSGISRSKNSGQSVAKKDEEVERNNDTCTCSLKKHMITADGSGDSTEIKKRQRAKKENVIYTPKEYVISSGKCDSEVENAMADGSGDSTEIKKRQKAKKENVIHTPKESVISSGKCDSEVENAATAKTESQKNKKYSTDIKEECNLKVIPSASKKKSEVQQWLNDTYAPHV